MVITTIFVIIGIVNTMRDGVAVRAEEECRADRVAVDGIGGGLWGRREEK